MTRRILVTALVLAAMTIAVPSAMALRFVDNFESYSAGTLAGQTAPNGQAWTAQYAGQGWAESAVISADAGTTGNGVENPGPSGYWGANRLSLGESVTSGVITVSADIYNNYWAWHHFGLRDTVSGKHLSIGFNYGYMYYDSGLGFSCGALGDENSLAVGSQDWLHDKWIHLEMAIDLTNRTVHGTLREIGGVVSGTFDKSWDAGIAFNPDSVELMTAGLNNVEMGRYYRFDSIRVANEPDPVDFTDDFESYLAGTLDGQTAPNGQAWTFPYAGQGWAESAIVSADAGTTGNGVESGGPAGYYAANRLPLSATVTSGVITVSADIYNNYWAWHQVGLRDTVSGKSLAIGFNYSYMYYDGGLGFSCGALGDENSLAVGSLDWLRDKWIHLEMQVNLATRTVHSTLQEIGGSVTGTFDKGPWDAGLVFNPDCVELMTSGLNNIELSRYYRFDNLEVTTSTDPGSVVHDMEYSDAVNVDGNLDDWNDADWKPFDMTYTGNPTDIIKNESAWAARWGAGGTKVYVAAKVRDTQRLFTDEYVDFNARDAIELYMHTTGSGHSYYGNQEDAQEWAIGVKDSNRNSVWATLGYPPHYGPPDYAPSADELVARGREVGEWLYYEVAITPLEYFGGLVSAPNIVSLLHENDVIGCDVLAVGYNESGFSGMLSSGHNEGGWFEDYNRFAKHKLVRSGVKGTITLTDFGASTLGASARIVITDASLVSETRDVVLDGSGTYSFETALRGTCTATASAEGYLPQTKSVTVDENGNGEVSFVLSKGTVVLPVVGASNKAVLDSIMADVASKYTWVFWGVVSDRTPAGFKLDDGSGVIIEVSGSNTVTNGDYVSVKGSLNVATKTLTMQSFTIHLDKP